MNYSSTADLKQAVLANCGELTDGSSEFDSRALEYLNKAYLAVHAGSSVFNLNVGDAWIWAKAKNPGILILREPYQTGTISFVSGNDVANFSVAPTESLAGWYVRPVNDPDWYLIEEHNAGETNFTMDSEYVHSSSVQAFLAVKTDYQLSPGQKIMRIISPFIVDAQQGYPVSKGLSKIFSMTEAKLMEEYPRRLLQCIVPSCFARTYEFDGDMTVRFSSYVGNKTRVRFDYIPVPNDLVDNSSDIPKVPREFRDFMEYVATYKLMLDKDDDRAQTYFGMAQAQLQALQNAERKEDSNPSQDRGRLIPRRAGYRYRAGRWLV